MTHMNRQTTHPQNPKTKNITIATASYYYEKRHDENNVNAEIHNLVNNPHTDLKNKKTLLEISPHDSNFLISLLQVQPKDKRESIKFTQAILEFL